MGWFFFAQASAPAPQVPAGWQDIVAEYGLSGSLAVLFVVMAWRYVPRVIESAIKLNERLGQAVEENAKSQLRMSIAIRKISRVPSGNSDAVRGILSHPLASSKRCCTWRIASNPRLAKMPLWRLGSRRTSRLSAKRSRPGK